MGLSLILFPLTHHSWAVFCVSLHMLSWRCHHLVCRAQPCAVVGVLEMGVSGMGQPWGFLTEAALQPPTSTWAPAPSTASGEGSHYVLGIYFGRPGIRLYSPEVYSCQQQGKVWEGALRRNKVLVCVLNSHKGVSCCLRLVEEVLKVARVTPQISCRGPEVGGWRREQAVGHNSWKYPHKYP